MQKVAKKPIKAPKKGPFRGKKGITKVISSKKIVPKKNVEKVLEHKPSMKVTKLKPSKSRDMAIPAYGFIDVCFCVDATGSMSS